MSTFIEVIKIVSEKEKDEEGNTVKYGLDAKSARKPTKQVKEVIRLDEVKSMRLWHKSPVEEQQFPSGDIIVLSMKDKDGRRDKRREEQESRESKSRSIQIKIYEEFNTFAERAGVITL